MDRKKTILIAVMINAGLLAVLFISAMTSDRSMTQTKNEIGKAPTPPLIETPAFQEPPMATLGTTAPLPLQIPLPEIVKEGTSLANPLDAPVHQLPPLNFETPPAQPLLAPTPPAAVAKAESKLQEVIVKKGDTLDKIAKSHRTSVEEMIKCNRLPNTFLRIGQVLKIPQEKGVAPKSVAAKTGSAQEYYTLKVGDSPWSVAVKNHMKLEELLVLNQLNEEKARKLKPGARLRIR